MSRAAGPGGAQLQARTAHLSFAAAAIPEGMERHDDNALIIYCDGSSRGRPRRGGMGVVFIEESTDGTESRIEQSLPGYLGASNQQMEIQACVEALRLARVPWGPVDLAAHEKIVIYSDSLYVVNGYRSAPFWRRSRWRTREGAPIENAEFWKPLLKEVARTGKRVEIRWVKGHKRNPHNRRADKLAGESSLTPPPRHLSHARVRRRLSANQTERGSVPMDGQTTTIRVITERFLPLQRCHLLKYEVVCPGDPAFQAVDQATADFPLRAGHCFDVRMGTEASNPRIEEMLDEVALPDQALR